MFFTRRLPFSLLYPSGSVAESDREIERFSLSKGKNGVFEEGKPLEAPFNKNPNEGAATISIDNLHLFYTIGKNNLIAVRFVYFKYFYHHQFLKGEA